MRYCPDCRAEYAPGAPRCHDCDVELVDLLVDDPAEGAGPLVTIAAFDTPVKASILASRLEAEGIECFIADAETIAAHGLLSAALGGVKVQVRGSDAPKAAELARRQGQAVERRACPRCGSTDLRRKGMSFLVAALAVVTLGVLALFFRPGWRCPSCGHAWE